MSAIEGAVLLLGTHGRWVTEVPLSWGYTLRLKRDCVVLQPPGAAEPLIVTEGIFDAGESRVKVAFRADDLHRVYVVGWTEDGFGHAETFFGGVGCYKDREGWFPAWVEFEWLDWTASLLALHDTGEAGRDWLARARETARTLRRRGREDTA